MCIETYPVFDDASVWYEYLLGSLNQVHSKKQWEIRIFVNLLVLFSYVNPFLILVITS